MFWSEICITVVLVLSTGFCDWLKSSFTWAIAAKVGHHLSIMVIKTNKKMLGWVIMEEDSLTQLKWKVHRNFTLKATKKTFSDILTHCVYISWPSKVTSCIWFSMTASTLTSTGIVIFFENAVLLIAGLRRSVGVKLPGGLEAHRMVLIPSWSTSSVFKCGRAPRSLWWHITGARCAGRCQR